MQSFLLIVHGQLETLAYLNQWQSYPLKKFSLLIAGKQLCEGGVCMVGVNIPSDVNETLQTDWIASDEIFLEEKGGGSWSILLFPFGWEYL